MWAREAQGDLEEADREGLQRVEALAIDPYDRDTWRSGMRSAISHACSKPATWKGAH